MSSDLLSGLGKAQNILAIVGCNMSRLRSDLRGIDFMFAGPMVHHIPCSAISIAKQSVLALIALVFTFRPVGAIRVRHDTMEWLSV
jgi:hypothetical protein